MIESLLQYWWIIVTVVAGGMLIVTVECWWIVRQNRAQAKKIYEPLDLWRAFAFSLDEPEQTQMFAMLHNQEVALGAMIRFAYWLQAHRLEMTKARRPPSGKSKIAVEPGVYVVESQGRYKIGMSTNVRSRISSLQTSNPYPITIVRVFWADNPEQLERQLHARFARRRLVGEWFALTPGEVHFVKAFNPSVSSAVSGATTKTA